MRKLMIILFSLVAALALVAAGSPADAEHAPEGTISVGLVDTCSSEDPPEPDGLCTWTATEDSGWVGVGPWTLTYDDGSGAVTVNCSAGEACQSPDPDPIPAGSVVSTDTTAGGTIAAGDPEEGE